ncbi:MAG: hypothetical protein GWP91_10810 [Rhodobacterales bacterium]|nr:hypothetical protein [Rhodobacterales bacterium]
MSSSYARSNKSDVLDTVTQPTDMVGQLGNAALAEHAGFESQSDSWLDVPGAIWDWLRGEEEEEHDTGVCPMPGEDRTGECEIPVVPYLSQRDNETEQVWDDSEPGRLVAGDAQCTPTATATALLGMLGDEGFRTRAETLFDERSQPMGPDWYLTSSPEHIIWTYIYLRTWDEWGAALPEIDTLTVEPHKSGMVQQFVLEEYAQASGTFNQQPVLNGSQTCQEAIEAIVQFPAVIGTLLTTGHSVVLTAVLSDGIIVHDPFGARGAQIHLKNGETGEAPPDHRWRYNNSFTDVDTTEEVRSDWGQDNFFNWAEVAQWSIGKWTASLGEQEQD